MSAILTDSQLHAYFVAQQAFTDSDIQFFMTIHKQFVEEKAKQPINTSPKKFIVDEDFMDLYMADVLDYAMSSSLPVKPKTPAEKARETRLRNKMELEKRIREEVEAKIKAEEILEKTRKAEEKARKLAEKARKLAEKEEKMRAMMEAEILAEKQAKKDATNAKRRETLLRKKMEQEQLAILHDIRGPGAQ